MLQDFKTNGISEDDVISQLKDLPFEDLEFAKVDHHRALRKGFPEVIFGQGKTPEHIASISEALLQHSDRLLVTRASPQAFDAVYEKIPQAHYEEMARCIVVDNRAQSERKQTPGVLVVCAGTADLPVATEAVVTAEMMGCEVERVFDVGVAGLHRLLAQMPSLQRARVVVAVAGMEGALPSRRGRAGAGAGHRSAYERGLRRELRRTCRAACDAQQLRDGHRRGEHRQRLRRGILGIANQSAACAGR